ncbi:hypothetical protein, partial [Burkholderia ubonensis]|uniref:hypothetical protein n=1 Tax=Burkholderia ubonensis TaxID=101571 RepID=UPI000AD1542B
RLTDRHKTIPYFKRVFVSSDTWGRSSSSAGPRLFASIEIVLRSLYRYANCSKMKLTMITRIVVGTSGLDIDESSDDIKQAWEFLSSQIQQCESDVAIGIVRNDGAVFGLVWDIDQYYAFGGTKERFLNQLRGIRFYADY